RRAARATSDTRTSESRDAPDSATRRRRRSPRTTALGGRAYASFWLLPHWRQIPIVPNRVAMSAPADGANEERCDIHDECEHVAHGAQPPAARAHVQSMIN